LTRTEDASGIISVASWIVSNSFYYQAIPHHFFASEIGFSTIALHFATMNEAVGAADAFGVTVPGTYILS
jgi:hypothetical protein